MKAVIQRVSSASVEVDGEVVGSIEKGILVLVAFSATDTKADIDRLVSRLIKLR
ncbi:MAG: D-aminoacyl-tRNA deacylase, partial [Leptonema sp. (in: Bacteria)]|nr:D-aminoacyl-tRNA deacylase [Leptonema sp. (in: bacteria)]